MTAPLIWIILPGLAAAGLYLARRWERFLHIAGITLALGLAWLAWYLPIDEPVVLRLWSNLPALRIRSEMLLFGSSFSLTNAIRPALVMVYLVIAFWFGGAASARTDRLFIPLGFGSAALLVASLAVQPAYFSAPLIGAFALLCVPILTPPGRRSLRLLPQTETRPAETAGQERTTQGALRFLIYEVVGVSLLLLGGLTPTPSGPQAALDVWQPQIILASTGLALVLGIFPFHTWMPMLAENSNPYPISFVFFLLPATVSFLALRYINQYAALEISVTLYTVLAYAGMLMALMGGLWAAFERHVGRILGFAAIGQTGGMLLALSLQGLAEKATPFPGLFFAQLAPQAAGLAVWALALSRLAQQTGGLSFAALRGAAWRMPLTCTAALLGNLSLAGLPLLASFPVLMALWSALAQQILPAAVLAISGSALLFFAALRTLTVMLGQPAGQSAEADDGEVESWSFKERGLGLALLIAGVTILFLLGLFPQVYFPIFSNLAAYFTGARP